MHKNQPWMPLLGIGFPRILATMCLSQGCDSQTIQYQQIRHLGCSRCSTGISMVLQEFLTHLPSIANAVGTILLTSRRCGMFPNWMRSYMVQIQPDHRHILATSNQMEYWTWRMSNMGIDSMFSSMVTTISMPTTISDRQRHLMDS